MNKKILFLAILLTSVLYSACSVSAACGIWRYKSDVENVRVNQSLNGEDAPTIAIGWSIDHTEDMSFYMELVGAEWDYGKSGSIQQGVTFNKVNKTTLEIMVDVGTGPDEINFGNGRNIYVPINCTPTQAGEIRVIIDPNESTVSAANILIAKAIDGKLTIHGSKTELNQSGVLKKITITDTSTQSYKANQKFTLTLDTGFHFDGAVNLTGTGKFEGLVSFEADKGNPSKAYITITGDTPRQDGEIIMENIAVSRKSDSKFNVVLMKAEFAASMVPLKSNLAVATYSKEAENAAVTQSEAATEATTATTTEAVAVTTEEAKASVVKIQIGADSYLIDERVYPLDVPAYIYGGSTMLPLRAMSNALGISDENISYDSASKTAVLALQKSSPVSVEITAGENNIRVTSGGLTASTPIDTPAQIMDGRLFLPLRAMANALGIADSDISYDAVTKTVTILNTAQN